MHLSANFNFSISSYRMASASPKPCQLCGFVAPTLTYLLQHIRQVHAYLPGFQISCGLSGCQRTFKSFAVYRNHVYGFHGEFESIIMQSTTGITEDEQMDLSENVSTVNSVDNDRRRRAAATWILKVQEQHKIPQSTMEEILKDVSGFVQDLLIDLHQKVNSTLQSACVDPSQVPGLAELFHPESEFAKPFSNLETQHMQLKFYRQNFNLIVSFVAICTDYV